MAGKELRRVRIKFVDQVNPMVLTQFLDHLLDDGVLNDQEKDALLEVNSSNADRARRLIDIVIKKGDGASRKMIKHIKEVDGFLYEELFPQGAQSTQDPQGAQGAQGTQGAQGAQVTQVTQGAQATSTPHLGFSDKLILTTEAFWRKQQMDEDVYPAFKRAIKCRVALLITNIEFSDKRHNRRGADQDEKNMEKLLSALGYKVVKHTNLTAQEIDEAVSNFSKHPNLKDTDSVVVVIMSHGKLGMVLGVNYRYDTPANEKPDEFPIDRICTHLSCPELEDKPKVIIIQACRGERIGSVPVWDGASQAMGGGLCSDSPLSAAGNDLEDDVLRFVNQEKDFIFLLSSTPHTKSYRHPADGSLLIQYLVDVFNTFAHEDHIEELFRKVSKRFEGFECGKIKQMASRDRCSLTKHFYFFPGI